MVGKRKIKPSLKASASSPKPPPKKRGRTSAAVKAVDVQPLSEEVTSAVPVTGSASARESRLRETLQAKEKDLMEKGSQLAAAQVVLASLETQVHQVGVGGMLLRVLLL